MLSDGTITLRIPTREDTHLLIDAVHASHAELAPWLPWASADYGTEDAHTFLDLVAQGSEQAFFIFDADGTMGGVCGLNAIDPTHRTANLGYWLRTDATGKGLATRATRLVALWGLAELDLRRIEVIASVENRASCQVAERAGFVPEGIRRAALRMGDGSQHDLSVYAVTREDLPWLEAVAGYQATDTTRIVSATRDIAADGDVIFALIADPARQPEWDGNANLESADGAQRVRDVGEVFEMTLTGDGAVRRNRVTEFIEGRRIAWKPSEPGKREPGHLWRWELRPRGPNRTEVTHTYDWTRLTDPNRLKRARNTTADQLRASLDRLADLAEGR